MIKIMIVDDMPIFLEYLRGCIDWNSYGFEICCEAHDGREALEKIEEFYPDVVLTDITMPYINGLELAERITKDYPDISVILITGNNEFEYARKAVKIGVCDYIVKPFEKEELILSLLKLHDNIGKAVETQTGAEEDVSKELDEELKTIIYAGISDKEALSGIEQRLFPKKEAGSAYLLSLFKFDTAGYAKTEKDAREKLMNWESLIAKLLADKIDLDGDFRIFHDFENNIVVLMDFESDEALDNYKGYEFTDILQVVKNQLEIGSSIAIEKAGSIGDVKKAYEKCLSFLSQKGYGQLWDLRKNKDEKSYASLDAIIRLNKDIETLQADDAENVINTLWTRLHDKETEEGKVSISDMNLITSAISILMTNIISSGFSIEKIYGEGFSPEKFMADAESSEKLRDNVIYLYRKRIEFEKGKKESKTHSTAQAAKQYIEENFDNNELSISDISEKLCVNQTYLRKMFKSEMDMTLTEYITQYRMQEAKRLITTTDAKLSEVAEKVGYSDVSYFSNVFKKYYGISPRSMSKE
ncbi:MAG: response regulator [Butyrivibrio sp.]|nr:response regulator [Butyrivibrio sp.]